MEGLENRNDDFHFGFISQTFQLLDKNRLCELLKQTLPYLLLDRLRVFLLKALTEQLNKIRAFLSLMAAEGFGFCEGEGFFTKCFILPDLGQKFDRGSEL